jgi:DNA (cytosine-5)-methyltransferase 1
VELPVIDIFAGPGGLSEGFSRYSERDWELELSPPVAKREAPWPPAVSFRVALSVEKDEFAHRTLKLRALARAMRSHGCWNTYLSSVAQQGGAERLLESNDAKIARLVTEAGHEAWCATLGEASVEVELDTRIKAALRGNDRWVLIGGPPCQAYSLVGRARNKGVPGYVPENDNRHYLYKQYLGIVARHAPPVFVMENVKGLLSSEVGGCRMFTRILEDLTAPGSAVGRKDLKHRYRIVPVVEPESPDLLSTYTSDQYVVRMEEHGIPQARHRVILLGIRDDVDAKLTFVPRRRLVQAGDVLKGLPRLRSGISDFPDSFETWAATLRQASRLPWGRGSSKVATAVARAVDSIKRPRAGRGGEVLLAHTAPRYAARWFADGLRMTLNHLTRTHRSDDLHRYLFASCYAETHGGSPTLRDFPKELLPNHRSASEAVENGGYFGDRFRVQLSRKPSTTVTSHISKDGHYYIHDDPGQCRSLTVREAARLQTFPDDYLFCGPRTEQYHQVGNAVPPLLAVQVARVVAGVLE